MALYRCFDPLGIVHVAYDQSWKDKLDWNEAGIEDQYRPDEATCGYTNYMTRTHGVVTCIECLVWCLTTPHPEAELTAHE